MGTLLIDKLSADRHPSKASDLHITVGQPPVLRHHGRMRRLETKVARADDTTALMKSITPDRCQQELQEEAGPTSPSTSATWPASASPSSSSAATSAWCCGESRASS